MSSASTQKPSAVVARAVVAGLAGTAVMTAWQTGAAKLFPSDDESGSGKKGGDPWKKAPVPAQVARRFIRKGVHKDVPADRIPLLTNVMHWGYGTGWGVPYAVLAQTTHRARLGDGLLLGLTVWAASYAQLVPMGFYELPWKYPAKDVALDISYHLAYGLGVAGAVRLLDGRAA